MGHPWPPAPLAPAPPTPWAVPLAAGHQRAGTSPDPSPFAAYNPPPLWRDVALFVGTALAVGSLVWGGLRRLVKR